MYRWFLLLTCGCAILPGSAQVPDPGTMAQELPRSSSLLVHPDQGTLLADVSARALSPSGIPLLTTPNTIRDDSQTPVPAADQVSASTTAPAAPALDLPYDASNIRDTIGPISIRPLPDAAGQLPVCFQQVDFFRKHNDNIMAIAYLRQLITYGNFIPQYKARAILELADCLDAAHQKAEALCWLKIWAELFPARPEMGSVAYRIATLYTQMGLSDLARDAYYLALAHTVNDGQVQSAVDLKSYSRLTEATLWGLSANEYQSGNWARAAELFERYRKEAPSASAFSLEKASYLQADCYYQLKQADKAATQYETTLAQHPFNPLAPEARLRLYHLYILKNEPEKARAELESLAWTVRTVWPKDETYWQKQTARLLLALNQKNNLVLPPLVQESALLPPEGKTWQEALNHYDALVSYQAVTTQANMDSPVSSSLTADPRHGLAEENDLQAMNRYLNQVLPQTRTASTQ